jgi:hypothetical protein
MGDTFNISVGKTEGRGHLGHQGISGIVIQSEAEETHIFYRRNNFIDFQGKTFLVTQKIRYFNATLTYITYGKYCQSVLKCTL